MRHFTMTNTLASILAIPAAAAVGPDALFPTNDLRAERAQESETAVGTIGAVADDNASFTLKLSETETITADLHADDLVAVIDRFDLAPADVVGYCSGAGIALVAAAREPRRIGRLALVCGEFMLSPSACRQSGFQREVAVVLPAAASSRDDAAMLQEKIADGAKPATHEFHDFVALPFSTGEHLYRFGRNYLAYRAVDMLATAAAVPHEALVIATRQDEQVPLDNAAIVAGCLPGAGEPVVLDGDHYELCRGNPDITAELDRFLTASGRPAPARRPD